MKSNPLPRNIDLENAILGSVIVDGQLYDDVASGLANNAWYSSANALIWAAISSVKSHIDTVSVIEALESTGDIVKAGGPGHISSLINCATVSGANIGGHVERLNRLAALRGLYTIGQKLCYEVGMDGANPEEIIGKAYSDLLLQTTTKSHVEHISSGISEAMHMAEMATKNQGMVGIKTGLLALDKKLGGWCSSDLVIVAGRPGMGKTGFALTTALAMATEGPVLFCSLEMSHAQLAMRAICASASVDIYSVRTGSVSRTQFPALSLAAGSIAATKLYVDDSPGQRPSEIVAQARKLHRTVGLCGVVVDYIQLMHGDDKFGSRELEVSSFTKALKGLAKQLDVPVIALSQLSRAVEQRGGDKKPILSDLRESGSIEQDADIVLFPHRPGYYDESLSQTEAEIIVAKHRQGPTGLIKVGWDGPRVRYFDLETQHVEEGWE
jgi:replicative DNA helicase